MIGRYGRSIRLAFMGVIIFIIWVIACMIGLLMDILYFGLILCIRKTVDERIYSIKLLFWAVKYFLFDKSRCNLKKISKHIKRQLYGKEGKIGWGYYKNLKTDQTPDDASFEHKLELVAINEESIVLDIGCGYGWFSQRFAKRFPKSIVYGLDIDPHCIFIAKERSKNISNVVWNTIKKRFSDVLSYNLKGTVDAIFLIGVVNELTIEQVSDTFQQAYLYLKKEGEMYVSFIDREEAYWDMLAYGYANYCTANIKKKEIMLKHITDNGFKIKHFIDNTKNSCIPHFEFNRSRSHLIFGPCLSLCYKFLLSRWLNYVKQGRLISYNVVLRK
eukprot:64283_1